MCIELSVLAVVPQTAAAAVVNALRLDKPPSPRNWIILENSFQRRLPALERRAWKGHPRDKKGWCMAPAKERTTTKSLGFTQGLVQGVLSVETGERGLKTVETTLETNT